MNIFIGIACTYFLNVKRKYEITVERNGMKKERTCVRARDIKCIDIQYHFFYSRVVVLKVDHISPRINSWSKGSSLTCDVSRRLFFYRLSFVFPSATRPLVSLYFQDRELGEKTIG